METGNGNDYFKETNFNDFYLFSLPILEWKKLSLQGDIPEGRSSHTAIAYNKKIFIFGGIIRETSKEFFYQKNLLEIFIGKY